MLTREQKKNIVNNLAADLARAKSVVFSDFKGLKTRDSQELRANLRKEGISHKVVKITLLKRALGKSGADISNFNVQVPVAVSISFDDEVAPA
ncbi:50S ribosomal protein L10, partial [Candidatus Kaiserbacteria bacterium RIFCSPLOWO2_12_FULL_52_8]